MSEIEWKEPGDEFDGTTHRIGYWMGEQIGRVKRDPDTGRFTIHFLDGKLAHKDSFDEFHDAVEQMEHVVAERQVMVDPAPGIRPPDFGDDDLFKMR